MSELIRFMSFSSKEEGELVRAIIDKHLLASGELIDRDYYYILRFLSNVKESNRVEIANKLKEWQFIKGINGYGKAYYRLKRLCEFGLVKSFKTEKAKHPIGGGREREIFKLSISPSATTFILDNILRYIKEQVKLIEKGKTEVDSFI